MRVTTILGKMALIAAVAVFAMSEAVAATPVETWTATLDPSSPVATETGVTGTGTPGVILLSGTAFTEQTLLPVFMGTNGHLRNSSNASVPVDGKKYFNLQYKIDGDINPTDVTVFGDDQKWSDLLTIPPNVTKVWVYITPVNDAQATGACSVTVGIQGGKGSPSSVAMTVTDDDIKVALTTPVPRVSESGTAVGAFRTEFSTTNGTSTGGLDFDGLLEFKIHLDNMTSSDPTVRRDATPGKADGADYLLIAMPAHASAAVVPQDGTYTRDFGSESMFNPSMTKRIQDWTRGWRAVIDAKEGDGQVFVNAGNHGQFLPLDWFFTSWGGAGNTVTDVEYGYLVIQVTTITASGDTTTDMFISFNPPGTPGQTTTTNISGGTLTTTVSSTRLYRLQLAFGLDADISKGSEVFNYFAYTLDNGAIDSIRVGVGGYYGYEFGYLPLGAVLSGKLTDSVTGAKVVRASLTDSTDFVVTSPGVAQGLIMDDDSYAGWNSVVNAVVNKTTGTVTTGNAVLTWTAPLPIDTTVSITVDASDGTAVEGADFVAIPRAWSLPAGSTSLTIPVTPMYNTSTPSSSWTTPTDRDGLKLRLRILASDDYVRTAQNGTVGSTVDVAILAYAGTATITADAPSVTEGINGAVPASFTIAIDRTGINSPRSVAVTYTVSGTATSGSDFTALTGVVTIPASANSVSLPVSILADSVAEGTETLIITLTESGGYGLGTPSSATLNIIDSSPTIAVTVASSDQSTIGVTEGGTVDVTFSYTGADRSSFSVPYTLSGSAILGKDYDVDGTSGVVTFDTNVHTKTMKVTTKTGALSGTPNIIITLKAASFYSLDTGHQAVAITINGTNSNNTGEGQPPSGAGGGSTSSGCGLGSGVAGILLGLFLLMRLRLRSDKRSRAA